MKAFREIFRLEWRALVRSRAFALMLVASVAWMFAVPHLVKDDGTAAGAFELNVRYSIGVVFALVLVSLASSAAGSLSKEREARRLQLTLVRPVRHFVVALARMFALVSAGAVILGVSSAVLVAQVGVGRECDHVLAPVMESPKAEADRLFDEYMEKYPDFREKVKSQGEREVRLYLVQYVKDQLQTVATNETASWRFDLKSVPQDAEMAVRVRVTDLFGRLRHVGGEFSLGGRKGALSHINKTIVRVPLEGGSHSDGDELVFRNEGGASVTINPRNDLNLLVRADSFAWNAFRAWLELTSVLSLIVAVAVFLGAALGRSVAVFSVVAMLVVMVVSPSVLEDYPDPTTMNRVDRMSLALTEAAARVTAPFSVYSPVSALESDSCVERAEALEAVGVNVVLLPLVFALLSGLVMSRKSDLVSG